MGQVITRLSEQYEDLKIVSGYDIADNGKYDYPVFTELNSCDVKVDVIIDFSNPAALNLIAFATEKTTDYSGNHRIIIRSKEY